MLRPGLEETRAQHINYSPAPKERPLLEQDFQTQNIFEVEITRVGTVEITNKIF